MLIAQTLMNQFRVFQDDLAICFFDENIHFKCNL
jgi:hypothetical protein